MPHSHTIWLIYLVLVTLLASASAPAGAAPPDNVRVGFGENGTYAFNESGEGKGSLVEIAHAAFKEMGRPATIRVYPLKRLYALLKNNQIDMAFTIENSRLEKNGVVSSKVPLMVVQVHLYTFKSGPVPSVWDLADENILGIDGYTYSGVRAELEKRDRNIRFIEAISPITVLRMLRAGRATYMLGYKRPMEHAIRSIGAGDIRSALIRDVPMYFHMLKSKKEAVPLLQELDAALRTVMKRTGHSALPR
ncbi:MAG: transporter substrate-binding domain-containing protein [Kordiimonadaceae bacterium]|nr:transporter substrate-binding domain-containing protein [Kordiimonadaceae bacterium]